MRTASSAGNFPYTDTTVCYIAHGQVGRVTEGSINKIPTKKDEIESAIEAARVGNIDIYAVWPGRTRSDLFKVDDLSLLANAWGLVFDD